MSSLINNLSHALLSRIVNHPALTVFYAILFIIVYLVLWKPFFTEAAYRLRVQRFRRSGINVGHPYFKRNFPYGIPALLRILAASRRHQLFQYFVQRGINDGTKTLRSQGIGRFAFFTSDPENIKAILSTDFQSFGLGSRHRTFYPLLGDGIFTLDGAGWQHTRALLRPQFTRQQISHSDTLDIHTNHLVNILLESKGNSIDVQPLFYNLTLDTATEFLLGESVHSQTGGNPKYPGAMEFGRSFSNAQQFLTKRLRAQAFYKWVDTKEFRQWCDNCKDFVMNFVTPAINEYESKSDEERKSVNEKYVFLNELVKETRDPVLLRDQALNILVAGRDTTASLLGFVFYFLSFNPSVYQKLRSIILTDFGEGSENLNFEFLKRCIYLRNVINETLRVCPIVPVNMRTALKDVYLPRGGRDPSTGNPKDQSLPVFIPKGSAINYSVYVMHHDTDYWGPDAEVFRPERWEEKRPNQHAWDYLPFNGGPRICLGQQLALTEASYTIVKILQKFKAVENATKKPSDPRLTDFKLTMSLHDGTNLKFIPA